MTKKFGKFTAVSSLDLTVDEGECYGLIGPNGSGKTTTIKILCGLIRATSGTAEVLGEKIPCRSVLRDIGYMPQETAVYLDNTVHENLFLFGEIHGLSKKRIMEREAELLEFVDLSGWRNSLASTLSGGMKHRLSLACTLIHEPRFLFLDEPTVGVDPELRETFWNYFEEMGKNGITVVITTHYMDEANHCSKVGLIRQGKIIAEGKPDAFKKKTGTESLEDAYLILAGRNNG